jgi:glycosyltransferase involved in cell wall biosynthesis
VPDAFDLRPGKLVGRRAAGAAFLNAWIRHSGADPITGYVISDERRDAFADHVRALDEMVPIASANPSNVAALAAAGAPWIGDPGLAALAWQRRWHRQTDWSLVGITHTICSHAAIDQIVALLRAPIQPWDALICTSNAAKQAVTTVIQAEAEYLNARMGATRFTIPQLPVIPLGVDCDALESRPADRMRWRAELGIGEADVAVLQFGRIAHHAKAHPLPLYRALAEAGRRLDKRLRLILAGQFANPGQEREFRALAEQMTERVATHFVDGTRADVGTVRAAADIGALLSDNIQETFGLAPVELMAAGLPVVGTDWDGLRDTIEQGRTGFRVDTLMPPPGAGAPLAFRYARDGRVDPFMAAQAQSTAYDIGQAATAFETLARDPGLRADMGAAARESARARHDWRHVIRAYRDLLAELATLRREARKEIAPRRGIATANPGWPDPYVAFAGYATGAIGEDMLIRIASDAPDRVDAVEGGTGMTVIDPGSLPSIERIDAFLAALRDGPQSLVALVRLFPDTPPPQIAAAIGWLLKFGFAVRA